MDVILNNNEVAYGEATDSNKAAHIVFCASANDVRTIHVRAAAVFNPDNVTYILLTIQTTDELHLPQTS